MVVQGWRLVALALALFLRTLAADTAPTRPEDCGYTWQQEYKSLHAAIRLGGHAQRYTTVSYHELGKTQTRTNLAAMLLKQCTRDELKAVRAGLSDLT